MTTTELQHQSLSPYLSDIALARIPQNGDYSTLAPLIEKENSERTLSFVSSTNPSFWFQLDITAAIDRRKDLYINPLKSFLFPELGKLVWQPQVFSPQEIDLASRPEYHPKLIDRVLLLPPGARLGLTTRLGGNSDQIITRNTPFSPFDVRSNSNTGKGFVDEEERFVRQNDAFMSRRGIMLGASINSSPLRAIETYTELGKVSKKWRELPFYFWNFHPGFDPYHVLQLSNSLKYIKDKNKNKVEETELVVPRGGMVLELTLFDGVEEKLLANIFNVEGYRVDHKHSGLEAGSRCSTCGHLGRNDNLKRPFETFIKPRNETFLRKDSVHPIKHLRLVILNPLTEQEFQTSGRVSETCKTCFPASCHELHLAPYQIPLRRCAFCNEYGEGNHQCAQSSIQTMIIYNEPGGKLQQKTISFLKTVESHPQEIHPDFVPVFNDIFFIHYPWQLRQRATDKLLKRK